MIGFRSGIELAHAGVLASLGRTTVPLRPSDGIDATNGYYDVRSYDGGAGELATFGETHNRYDTEFLAIIFRERQGTLWGNTA